MVKAMGQDALLFHFAIPFLPSFGDIGLEEKISVRLLFGDRTWVQRV